MSWQHKLNFLILFLVSMLLGAILASCYIFTTMQRPACYENQALLNIDDEYVCLYIKDLKGGL